MTCEAYEFVGKHEWLIPVFLFRNHEDAGQYIYTLSRDPDRKREVLGRKGDDFIAIVVNEQGKVTRFIAGEAKWRGELMINVYECCHARPQDCRPDLTAPAKYTTTKVSGSRSIELSPCLLGWNNFTRSSKSASLTNTPPS